MTGFEPATPATRTRCATKLRYIPLSVSFKNMPASLVTIHWFISSGRILYSKNETYSIFYIFIIKREISKIKILCIEILKFQYYNFFVIAVSSSG